MFPDVSFRHREGIFYFQVELRLLGASKQIQVIPCWAVDIVDQALVQ